MDFFGGFHSHQVHWEGRGGWDGGVIWVGGLSPRFGDPPRVSRDPSKRGGGAGGAAAGADYRAAPGSAATGPRN